MYSSIYLKLIPLSFVCISPFSVEVDMRTIENFPAFTSQNEDKPYGLFLIIGDTASYKVDVTSEAFMIKRFPRTTNTLLSPNWKHTFNGIA